jgi:hypothetical protein
LYFALVGSPAKEFDNNLKPLWLGLYAVFVGFLPVWFTGRDVLAGQFADRFALPSMLGAALAVVALLQWLLRTHNQRVIVISLLVSLSLGLHLRVGNDFRWDWTRQKRYYAQLITRLPGLDENTALITGGSISSFVNGYVSAMAVNALYHQVDSGNRLPYWVFNVHQIPDFDPEMYIEGQPLQDQVRNLYFEGMTNRSILSDINDDAGTCLWVITPLDAWNVQLPEKMARLANSAHLSIVDVNGKSNWDAELFGDFPYESWCLNYQRASLAVEQEDWTEAMAIYQTVLKNGQTSIHGYEYIPYIQALAETGDWTQAAFLTSAAYKKSIQAQSILCAVWDQLAERGLEGQALEAYQEVIKSIRCGGG